MRAVKVRCCSDEKGENMYVSIGVAVSIAVLLAGAVAFIVYYIVRNNYEGTPYIERNWPIKAINGDYSILNVGVKTEDGYIVNTKRHDGKIITFLTYVLPPVESKIIRVSNGNVLLEIEI